MCIYIYIYTYIKVLLLLLLICARIHTYTPVCLLGRRLGAGHGYVNYCYSIIRFGKLLLITNIYIYIYIYTHIYVYIIYNIAK